MDYGKLSDSGGSGISGRRLIDIEKEEWSISGGTSLDYTTNSTGISTYSKPAQVESITHWIASNTSAYFGYLPKNEKKLSKLKQQFSELELECLSYLSLLIIVTVGYGHTLKFHSAKLKRLLGNRYKSILRAAERIGLLSLVETPTQYKVNSHNEIAVIGQRGKSQRIEITNINAIARIYKYRLERIDTDFIKVIAVEYNSLLNSTIVGDHKFEALNVTLPLGFHIPTIDKFGFRLHCSYTFSITSKDREKIRCTFDPNAEVCEIDITSSQPFFLFQIFLRPELIDLLVKDPQEQQKIKEVFNRLIWSTEILWKYGNSLECGDFYSDFLGEMLDVCCGGKWRLYIDKKAQNDSEIKRKPKTRRDSLKMGFMYLANGGANMLLKQIEENELYRPFAELLLSLQKVELDSNKPDLVGVREYSPHKNLAMLLQRIEAKFVHRVYLKSGIEWGFLIHDAILIRKKEKHLVMSAVGTVARELGISIPTTKS